MPWVLRMSVEDTGVLVYLYKGKLTNKPINLKFFSPLSLMFTPATNSEDSVHFCSVRLEKSGLLRWIWIFMGVQKF